jgi:hypothetical protein
MDSLTWELMQLKLPQAASWFSVFKTASVPSDQGDPVLLQSPPTTKHLYVGRITATLGECDVSAKISSSDFLVKSFEFQINLPTLYLLGL